MAINSISGNTLLQSGFFPPARVASTGSNINLTTGGLLTIDGVVLVAGDRVLVKDQTDQTTNGIYAANTGPWVRTSDASQNTQFFSGMGVVVALGTVNAKAIFLCTCTDDPVVIGTSLITFAAQLSVGSGNVAGPGSSTSGHVATFADGTGKVLADTTVTGSGSVVKATSPALTTPNIDAATATSINKVTITQPASGSTLTIADGKTLTANKTLTLAGTDGKTLTINASLTLGGVDGKTLTVDNNLEFAGNDSTKFTFPGASDTVVTLGATQTLTSKTLTTPSISSPALTGNASAVNLTVQALNVTTTLITQTPVTLTGTSGTTNSISQIINSSNNFTLTLPNPATLAGQWLYIKQIAAFTVASASSNVVPIGSATPGTAMLSGQGKWAWLQSDGSSWITMAAN